MVTRNVGTLASAWPLVMPVPHTGLGMTQQLNVTLRSEGAARLPCPSPQASTALSQSQSPRWSTASMEPGPRWHIELTCFPGPLPHASPATLASLLFPGHSKSDLGFPSV